MLGAVLVLRVLMVVCCPLDLVPDEAYYWDWSRRLDWSYYSKPPLIAWIIAVATMVGGTNEIALRLPAALFGTIGLWAIFDLGRSAYSERVGLWAMVAIAVTPGLSVMSLLMTIDAPFLCAWSFAIACLWRLLGQEQKGGLWLFGAVVATGLGLLAKQTMLLLFPLVFGFLLTDPAARQLLRQRTVWVWFLGSLSFLLPVVWWNWHHDWLTVQHTREHFQVASVSIGQRAIRFVEFWASQFGIVSPVLFNLGMITVFPLLVRFRTLERRERFFLWFGVIPVLGVALLSLMQRMQPNWPAPFHLTSLLLAAAWGCNALPVQGDSVRRWAWFRRSLIVGVCLSTIALLVLLVLPLTPLRGTNVDPTGRLRGWKDLAQAVAEFDRRLADPKTSVGTAPLVIAATARGPVSELAFYLPNQPRVYRWNDANVIDSQHDLWGGPSEEESRRWKGHDAVIVTQDGAEVPPRLQGAFATVVDGGPVVISLGSGRHRYFQLWRGMGFRGWPKGVSNAAD